MAKAIGTRHLIPGYEAKLLRMLRAGDATNEQITAAHGLRTRLLNRLVLDGLIERKSVNNRSVVYSITDAGRAACPPRNPAAASRTIVSPQQGEGVQGSSLQRKGGLKPAPERLY